MKIKPFFMGLLYIFFFLAGSVYGIGEKTISLGAAASWNNIDKKYGVIEAPNIRPHPVLVLSGELLPSTRTSSFFQTENENSLDLHLSFDEGRPAYFTDSQRNYDVYVSSELASVGEPLSRVGRGAVLFTGRNNINTGIRAAGSGEDFVEGPLVLKPRRNALFAPESRIRDFTIEFWLYPQNLENGEQILYWNSSKPDGRGGFFNQRIQCITSRDRLVWTFTDFFFSPGEKNRKAMSLTGPSLVSKSWSHHLIRFDADLGLLEYLVNGKLEALDYTSVSGREGGEVYTPVIGENCRFVLGGRFNGLMDDFIIHNSYIEKNALTKYANALGRVETKTLDIGYLNSRIIKIEAFGGRTTNTAGKVANEYTGQNTLHFQDHTQLDFFFRLSNNPYLWNEIPWIPFSPGTELTEMRGRYIQIAADFYPSGDGETSPYISELKIIYEAAEPPPPPPQISATAKDGAVELSWRASPSREVSGYYVYFGTAKGEYFALQSPIDAGNTTSVRIDGLSNGTLYYFAVAAYSETGNQRLAIFPEPGEFSREVAARPLKIAN